MSGHYADQQLADDLRRAFTLDTYGTDGLDAQLRAIVLEEIGPITGETAELKLAAARVVGRLSVAYADLASDVIHGRRTERDELPAHVGPTLLDELEAHYLDAQEVDR